MKHASHYCVAADIKTGRALTLCGKSIPVGEGSATPTCLVCRAGLKRRGKRDPRERRG